MKNPKMLMVFLISSILLISACNQTIKYVCPDGSSVDNSADCQTQNRDVNQNSVNIVDNTQRQDNQQNILNQESVQKLKVVINSATKENNINTYIAEKDVGLGFIYFVLDVTIENQANYEYDFNPSYTNIIDNGGYGYERDVSSYRLKPYFDSRKILSGEKSSGKLSYAIPKEAKGLRFVIYNYNKDKLAEVEIG